MKFFMVAALLGLSINTEAAFIARIYKYINIKTGELIEASVNDIEDDQVKYFDYSDSKRKKVPLIDLSKQTNDRIAGVKAGELVLVPFGKETKPCEVYYVFANGMARIGCQTGKMLGNISIDRPAIGQFNLNHVANVIPEVATLDGRNKKDYAVMSINIGKLKAGANVRIEAIFANGEALVQKMNISFLDSSGVIRKHNIERVKLEDLK